MSWQIPCTRSPCCSEALTPSSTCTSLVSSSLITTKSSLSARSVAQCDTVWRNCKGSWYDLCERKSGRWAGWCTLVLIRFCVFNVDFDVRIISYLVFYFSVFVSMFSYLVWFLFFLGFSDKTIWKYYIILEEWVSCGQVSCNMYVHRCAHTHTQIWVRAVVECWSWLVIQNNGLSCPAICAA